MTSWRKSTDRDVTILNDRDARYPERLRTLGDLAPPTLYCRGNLELLDSKQSIAIIGARDSTEYGDSVAETFACDLARRGVTIISGLARGIDGIAHKSALDVGGGTVAVLGCGIDVYYPQCNARLQDQIAHEGLLISEFAPGTPAYKNNFRVRNRIIALLAHGLFVVEAKHKSGTHITVEWALRYSQTVFAVPGPIGRAESEGTNAILMDGGAMVVSPRDIMEVMGWRYEPIVSEVSEPVSETKVLSALGSIARHVDVIAQKCGLTSAATLMELLELELEGLVVQHPGKRFSKPIQPASLSHRAAKRFSHAEPQSR